MNEYNFLFIFYRTAWRPLNLPAPGSSGYNWSVSCIIDLRTRSDTGKINTPPVVTMISPVYIPFGVQRALVIPTIDGDHDEVRCRFAESIDECSNVCPPASLPNNSILISSNCTLLITGANVGDWYAVALQVSCTSPWLVEFFSNRGRRFCSVKFNISNEFCSRSISHQCLCCTRLYNSPSSIRSIEKHRHMSNFTSGSTIYGYTVRSKLLFSIWCYHHGCRYSIVSNCRKIESYSKYEHVILCLFDMDTNDRRYRFTDSLCCCHWQVCMFIDDHHWSFVRLFQSKGAIKSVLFNIRNQRERYCNLCWQWSRNHVSKTIRSFEYA